PVLGRRRLAGEPVAAVLHQQDSEAARAQSPREPDALLDRLAIVVKVDDRATAGRGGDLERVHANAVRRATVASHDVIRSPDRWHLFCGEKVVARDDAPRADEPGRQCEETERGTDRLGPHVLLRMARTERGVESSGVALAVS